MKTEIEKFQSGFSGMPGVSQNHYGSTKRRLQPILLLDEALGLQTPRAPGQLWTSGLRHPEHRLTLLRMTLSEF